MFTLSFKSLEQVCNELLITCIKLDGTTVTRLFQQDFLRGWIPSWHCILFRHCVVNFVTTSTTRLYPSRKDSLVTSWVFASSSRHCPEFANNVGHPIRSPNTSCWRLLDRLTNCKTVCVVLVKTHNLWQSCSRLVPSSCFRDVLPLPLLVPSLLTTCLRFVDKVLQGRWSQQTCYNFSQQLPFVLWLKFSAIFACSTAVLFPRLENISCYYITFAPSLFQDVTICFDKLAGYTAYGEVIFYQWSNIHLF